MIALQMNNEINVLEYSVTFIKNGHDDLNPSHDDLVRKKCKESLSETMLCQGLPTINLGSWLIYKKTDVCARTEEEKNSFFTACSGGGNILKLESNCEQWGGL